MTQTRDRQGKHLALLLLLAVGMFGFAFALVPLYDVFCEITGLNGKTSGRARASDIVVQEPDREVTVQFLGYAGNGMPWEFRPMDNELRVQPGKMYTTRFYARNRAGRSVIGQAVPSVSPGRAAVYLRKTECFCFVQQRLDAGEAMEMPVSFYVDADLPKDIGTLTLSYTFFRLDMSEVGG